MFRFLLTGILLAMAVGATSVAALEDPTRPPGYGEPRKQGPSVREPRWRLMSTLIAPGRRVANINGRLVHQGETIGGARLVSVQPAAVVLQHKGRRFSLSLLPKDFKQIQGAR